MNDTTDDVGAEEEASTPVVPTSTKLNGFVIHLKAPPSLSTRWDVVDAVNKNQFRGMATALGLCWQYGASGKKPKARYEDSFNPMIFGGHVLDALLERGAKLEEIMAAASDAYTVITDGLRTEDAVEAAAGN